MVTKTWRNYVKRALQRMKRADKVDEKDRDNRQYSSYLTSRSNTKHSPRQSSGVSQYNKAEPEPETNCDISERKNEEYSTTFEDTDMEDGEEVTRTFGVCCNVCYNRSERCIKVL